jgi:hypothetical protein
MILYEIRPDAVSMWRITPGRTGGRTGDASI